MAIRNLPIYAFQKVFDFSNLFKSALPASAKLRITAKYFSILFKSVFLRSRPWSERIFGYNLKAYQHGSIKSLYDSLFLRNEYFFVSSKKNPKILDCGANIGGSLLYFKFLYPGAQVKCFEPDPRTFEMLRENAKQFTSVKLEGVALTGKDGMIDFYTESPGSLVSSVNSKRTRATKIKVQAKRLSSFVNEQIDFLKLDIEGAETEVLSELQKSGKLKFVKEMVVEYHHRIGNQKADMARLLSILETDGFDYQLSATALPLNTLRYQDIMVYARRV